MLFLSVAIIFSGFVFIQAISEFPEPLDYYANERVFVEGRIRLFWNYTETSFIGELHALTYGWVGFGLSPNGGMSGSDVFVAQINSNGEILFTDRYINDNREVLVDDQQDWNLLASTRQDDYLMLKFQRKINTCDSNGQDIAIDVGTQKVIYAWSDDGADISNHGASNRGTSTLPLLSTLKSPLIITNQDAIEIFDITVNASVPQWSTYYHCEMFKLPGFLLNNKRHLLRTVTQITPGNENYVHHWLMYQCDSSFETEYVLSGKPYPLPGHCFDYEVTDSANPTNTWTQVRGHCKQITLVWAIGGDLTLDFPNGLGFPLGGPDAEFKYFVLEIHYNNPEYKSGILDQSLIQFHVTPKLRDIEIGVFTNGAISDWSGIIIPPGQEAWKLSYYCTNTCLNGLNQGDDITIFAVAPHTHTVGSAVVTTLIRNGKEVQYITKSLNYDFNYQHINFLQESVVVKPGDEIRTTCTYKTVSQSSYTFGGFGTPQEMVIYIFILLFFNKVLTFQCLDFLFYYPRRKNTGYCLSLPSGWEIFFGKVGESGGMTFSEGPTDYLSLSHDLKSLETDASTINIVRTFFETANQTQYCITNGSFVATTYPRKKPADIVEMSVCEASILSVCSRLQVLIFIFYKIFF